MRWTKQNLVSNKDGTDTYKCGDCRFRANYTMHYIPLDCPKCIEKEIIFGCWSIASSKSIKCEYCESYLVECPIKDHPNSKFWALQKHENEKLYVCPNGCLESGTGRVNSARIQKSKKESSMKIVICSKQRSDKQLTLNLIGGLFPKEDIVLLVEPKEYKLYKKYRKLATIMKLPWNGKGLRASRAFALILLKKENIIFFLDDDISDIRTRSGKAEKGYWKLRKCKKSEIISMFKWIEKFLITHPNYGQATISYVPYNWSYKKKAQINTHVWVINAINNKVLKEKNVKYPIANGKELFEAYDFSLEIFSKGLKNVRFYKWAFSTIFDSKGGVYDYRHGKVLNKSVKYMEDKWGGYVEKFFSKSHNLPEIKVRWRAIGELINPQSIFGKLR